MTVDAFDRAAPPLPGDVPVRARLLVVDDQPINIRALHQVFSDDLDVFMATSGEDALAFCRATPPDLVLLDVVMPGIDGLEVCRRLKRDPDTTTIPVIFVTALGDPNEEAACWDAGGVDFITKPISPVTVRNRVRAHLMLKYQSDLLRRMAWLDGLTGVANRRQFDERLGREWRRCARASQPLSVAAIDIDYFKTFNDTYGHLAGDDCLRRVARTIDSGLLRPGDLAARVGGEEFSCLLPEIGIDDACLIAGRIVSAIAALHIPHSASPLGHVTASIGVASEVPSDAGSHEALLVRADEALYRAKREGRAQVRCDRNL